MLNDNFVISFIK